LHPCATTGTMRYCARWGQLAATLVGVPIELTGDLSPVDAKAMGQFLVEMATLERAVDRALLDQYPKDDARDLFIVHFLDRKTLGPKCDALIAIAANAHVGFGDAAVASFAEQLRELVRVRNAVAHESPTFEYQVEHSEPLWGNELIGFEHGEIRSTAKYGSIDMDAADLVAMTELSVHVRQTISKYLHRELTYPDQNDDDIVQ